MPANRIRVKVKLYMTLRDLFGWKERVVDLDKDGCRFKDLINIIPEIKKAIEKYSGKRWSLIILVNGRHIKFLGGDDAILKDGDVISLFPPLAGG